MENATYQEGCAMGSPATGQQAAFAGSPEAGPSGYAPGQAAASQQGEPQHQAQVQAGSNASGCAKPRQTPGRHGSPGPCRSVNGWAGAGRASSVCAPQGQAAPQGTASPGPCRPQGYGIPQGYAAPQGYAGRKTTEAPGRSPGQAGGQSGHDQPGHVCNCGKHEAP
jgi:hypothetical protein